MRRGDRDQEFRAFYFSEAARLKGIALLMVADRGRAEELTQEALLRAYKAWPRIRRQDPGPYVRTTLVNLCRNDYRRRLLERTHPTEAMPHEESVDTKIEEAMRLADALKALPPVRKAAVVLRYYEDLPEAEIARILDRPLNTVKSDIRRGLQALRPLLQEGAANR
jgi:RNA polymerase sigma-70 factor (sigma-E family)